MAKSASSSSTATSQFQTVQLQDDNDDDQEDNKEGIVHLTDESGKQTSTGFAEADAVYKQLVEWDLIKEIK